MRFEYDSEKSDSNKEKHGIDFSAAQALWYDPDYIEIPALTADEARFLVIGKKTLVGCNNVSGRKCQNNLGTTIKERGD